MHEDMPSRMLFPDRLRQRLACLPRRVFDPANELEGGAFAWPEGRWRTVAAASTTATQPPGAEELGLDYRAILRYGACKGLPLTQHGAELLRQQRECTYAALQGFARVGRRAANRVGLPNDVVHSILLMAGLEIEESIGYTPNVYM